MAFKPITKKSTVAMISLEDPAIDFEASDLKGFSGDLEADPPVYGPLFRDPGKWPDFIKAKPGEELTLFHVGAIPADDLNALEDRFSGKTRSLNWEVFCASLVDIDGGLVPVKVDPDDKNSRVKRSWIESTFVGPLRSVAIGIGRMAYIWQDLSEDDARP